LFFCFSSVFLNFSQNLIVEGISQLSSLWETNYRTDQVSIFCQSFHFC
jgi:hypothetical protein